MAGGCDLSGENGGGTNNTKRMTIAFIGAKSVGKTSIIRVSPNRPFFFFLLFSFSFLYLFDFWPHPTFVCVNRVTAEMKRPSSQKLHPFHQLQIEADNSSSKKDEHNCIDNTG